jgi:predicted ArsR family transcriptional regulator
MVRFDQADVLDDETPAADPRGATPVALPRRCPRRLAKAGFAPTNPLLEKAFPSWARPPNEPAVGADAGFEAALRASAGLAFLDAVLRTNPPFAGALRQRLALRAATACAAMARHREDSSALRDAEHLASVGAQTSPAGRVHRLWRLFASRPTPLDDSTLRIAADLIGLTDATSFDGLAEALRDIVADAETPLAAAAGASAAAMKLFTDAPPVDVEIFALWLADLALAQRLRWDAPVPLLATAFAHASLRRGPSGKRPRPADPDWVDAAAGAYAMAAQEAYALAGELARASEKLLAAQPKLRAMSAGRVVQLLLSDDAVSPARAAKAARLSDRAARRLFDRLIELGAVRELSGRSNFRFYGL